MTYRFRGLWEVYVEPIVRKKTPKELGYIKKPEWKCCKDKPPEEAGQYIVRPKNIVKMVKIIKYLDDKTWEHEHHEDEMLAGFVSNHLDQYEWCPIPE